MNLADQSLTSALDPDTDQTQVTGPSEAQHQQDMQSVQQNQPEPDQSQDPDFIPDNQFEGASATAPAQEQNQDPDFIPDNQFEPETQPIAEPPTGDLIKGDIEAIGEGVLSKPLAIKMLTSMGEKPEDILRREQELGPTHSLLSGMGFAGSMLTGIGEARALSQLGEAGANVAIGAAPEVFDAATKTSKLLSGSINHFIQGAGMYGLDEYGDSMLDKNAAPSVSASLANMGAAGLLNMGVGGVFGYAGLRLGEIGENQANIKAEKAGAQTPADKYAASQVQTMSQMIGSAADELSNLREGDKIPGGNRESVANEMSELWNTLEHAPGDFYGGVSLKDQEINRLSPQQMTDPVREHIQDTRDTIQDFVDQVSDRPKMYPPGTLDKALEQQRLYNQKTDYYIVPGLEPEVGQAGINPSSVDYVQFQPATPDKIVEPLPSDVFRATDSAKQFFQNISKYEGRVEKFSKAENLVNASRNISSQLRSSLEDPQTWANPQSSPNIPGTSVDYSGSHTNIANLQKEVNSAFSTYIKKGGPRDAFASQFVSKTGNVVNPNRPYETTETTGPGTAVDRGAAYRYYDNLNKPGSDIDKRVVQNWVNHGISLRDSINKSYRALNLETPYPDRFPVRTMATYKNFGPGVNLVRSIWGGGAEEVGSHVAGALAGTAIGGQFGGPSGALAGGVVGERIAPIIAKALNLPITGTLKRYVVPAVMKVLESGQAKSIVGALENASNVNGGVQKINRAIDALFKSGSEKAYHEAMSDRDRDRVQNFIEKGGVNSQIQKQITATPQEKTQSFAEGGEVLPQDVNSSTLSPVLNHMSAFGSAFPNQNGMFQEARARVSNYLNSVRPMPPMGQPIYDTNRPDPQKKRTYDRVTDLANHPLSILNNVKDGSLTPQTLNHFTSLYPELHQHLSKKITERINQSKLDGEKPAYHTRQAMGLFLGSPLDSTMTPQSIASIQQIFSQNQQNTLQTQAQQQSPGKTKKGTSKMGKLGESLQTPIQGATARLNSK